MPRYIEREKAFEVLTDYYHQKTLIQRVSLKEALGRVPTADVQEVRHGKFVYDEAKDVFKCSNCGRQMVRNIFDYCPWCGARMDQ